MTSCSPVPRLAAVAALVLTFLSFGVGSRGVAALDEAATAVVAQGVSALPTGQAVWSVSRPTAPPATEAVAAVRPLGFALATDDPILVTDAATGARQRLSRDEAVFTADGASQLVSTLDADATDYLRIVLEPSGVARDAPDDGPVYTSDAFPAPRGDRDVDLLTAVLDGETSLFLSSSKAPALIYAPDGLRYAVGRAAAQELGEGEAISLAGKITLFAPEESADAGPARVFVAVVGAALPTVAAPTPAATVAPSGAGLLSLTLTQCPSGSLAVPGGGATPAPCDPDGVRVPVPGVVVTLENVATAERFTLTLDVNGGVTESIAAGTYRIVTLGDVRASSRAVIASCVLVDPLASRPDILLDQLPILDGEAIECELLADAGAFDVAPPGGTLSVAFTVLVCPSGYAGEFRNPPAQVDGLASCDGDLSLDEAEVLPEGLDVVLVNGGGGTFSQTTGADGTTAFADLGPTSYTVNVLLAGAALEYRGVCGGTAADGTSLGLAGSISPTQALTVSDDQALDCTVLALQPGPDGDGDATLVVTVLACPAGTNLPTLQADGAYDCAGAPAGPDYAVELTSAGGDSRTVASSPESTATFVQLPSGQYALAVAGIDGGSFGICGSQDGLAGLTSAFGVGTGETVTCSLSILDADDWAAYQDVDTDGDFLTDTQEARLGTDPAVDDTDGDGALDGEEVYSGDDPLA